MGEASGKSRAGICTALVAAGAVMAAAGERPAVAETVLRIANAGEAKSLDPQLVTSVWENRLDGDMFLGLTTEDANAKPIPGAAESWEVSEDGRTYTFKLRPHAWSDGEPVTAEDFVFSMRRIEDPKTAAEYASLLYPIRNAEAVNTGKMAPDQLGVRAVDPQTLEITLNDPTGYFLELLAHQSAMPVPKHVVEAKGKDWVKPGTIVGNGAFMATEWVPNAQIVLVKNPKFYDAANVKIDKVVYVPGEERNAATKQFRANELDVQFDFASEQIDFLRKNLPEETRVAPWLGNYYYVFNLTKKPFDDPKVRRALSLAVDREALTEKVLRTGELPGYGFVPPGTGTYGAPAEVSWRGEPLAERQAEAKKLLTEAGFGASNPLKFQLRYNTSETHKKAAIAVAAMWKPLGVETELFNSEGKVHYDALKQAQFDVGRAAWIADYNDPQNFLYLLESRTGVLNYGRYKNEKFDALMIEAGKTLDQTKRMALMHEAEAIALEDDAVIPLWYYVSKNLVSTKVKGWVDNTKDIHRTRWLSIDGRS